MNDTGGFIELMSRFLVFLTFNISMFSFHLKAIQKMFLAKTNDDSLFRKSSKDGYIENPKNRKLSFVKSR